MLNLGLLGKAKWFTSAVKATKAFKALKFIGTIAFWTTGVKGFLQMREMLNQGQAIMANKTAAGGKIPVIYGTRRVGTQIVYMDTFGNDNRDLYVVYALAVGECEEILGKTIEIGGNSILDEKIFKKGGYVGSDKISSGAGSLCTADQNGDVNAGVGGGLGTDPTKRYQFVFNLHHGADSQTADPMLTASIPSDWTSDHKLNGICYIAAHFHYSKTGVFQGIPNITVQVKGKKVYDPRESGHTFGDASTYEWSSNPALCYLDYISNDEYGKGLAEADINMSTFETAADTCDVLVDQPYYNGAYQNITWSGTSGDDFVLIGSNTDWYQNKTDEVVDIRDNGGTNIFSGTGIKGVQRHQFYDDSQVNKVFIDGTLSSDYTNEAGSFRAKVKRFHCNGLIDTNRNVMDNAKELLANMRGIFTYINGKYELQIEDTGSSTFSITEDHIIADEGISVDYGNKDKKANKVVIEFYNSQLNYELDTATVLHDATPNYYSDDGEILEIKAQFPLVTDAYIAYNMGKAILTRSRNQISLQFLGTPEMYKLNVGDIVDVTYAGLGFSGKICRVESLELQSNGLVNVSLIEYFDVYTWEVPAQEDTRKLTKLPTKGAINPPDIGTIVFTDTDASAINRPTLTWTEPDDFDVKEFRVDVVDSSDNNVFSKIVDTPSVDLSFLPKASDYEASITSFNTLGVESEPVTKTFTIADSPTRTDDIQNSAITDAKVADISADKIDTGVLNLGTESGMAVRQAKTGYTDTTTGFWLGNDSGTPKFNIGTSSSYFKFDGSSVEVSGELSATTGSIGGFSIGTNDLTAGTGSTRISLSTTNGIHLGSNTFSAAPFRVALDGSLTATNANVTGDLETGNLIVTGSAGIHGEVRATSLTAGTVTVASINQEVWNEIDLRTAPTQNGFYDSYDSTSTGTYYNGVDTDFELLGTGGNGYLSNGQDVSIRTSMVHGYAQSGSQTYTGDALKATFQFQYKALPSGSWTDFGSSQVYTTDAYSTPDGFFYELDADPSATVSLSSGIYYQFRLNVTPTVTNNVWADSDANDVFAVAFAIQQSSTGTGAGTGTVTSIDAGDGLQTSTGSAITSSGSLLVDSTVVRTSGTQTIAGNKTFSNNVVIEGDLTVQGTTTTIDTTNLDVKDKNITLNYGTGDTSANADGAGITIQDAVSQNNDATILWTTANDTFNFSHPVSVTGNISTSNSLTGQAITVNSSGYGTIEVGGVSGAYIDLKRPNTDDYDLRLTTDGTGGVIDTGSGELTLKRQGSTKIATTSSGIDVTGTISNTGTHTITADSNAILMQTASNSSNYYAYISANHSYGQAFSLRAKGGGSEYTLMDWGDGVGLEFNGGSTQNIKFSSHNLSNIGTISSGAITASGLTVDTSTLVVDATNNRVGIGTDSPDKALTISASDSQVRLYDADGTNQFASFQSDNGIAKITSRNNTSNGQIAFQRYNGTVVNESMRIDSSGNVGINKSSPASKLHVHGTQSYGSLRISPTSTNGESAMGFFLDTAGTQTSNAWVVGHAGWGNTGDFVIGNQVFGGPVMLMQQDGNVGINQTSPSNKLDVVGHIEAGSFEFNALSGTAVHGTGLRVPASQTMSLHTNSEERMRIDSSGHVLVGRTSTSGVDVNGHVLFESGESYQSATSNTVQFINRNGTNGNLLQLYKSGSQFGSIGVVDADLTIYTSTSGHKGLRFGNGYIAPTDNTGTVTDNTTDLGLSSQRFKDLHLSGTANVNELQVDSIANIDGALTSGAITALGTVKAVRTDTLTQTGTFGQDSSGGYITQHRNNASLYENFRFLASNTSGTVERARIDTTGNLLVGKTLPNNTDTGIRIDGVNDFVSIVRAGNPCLILNRTTSDGVIMQLRRGTTTSGQIGITDSAVGFVTYFASGNSSSTGTGLKFISVTGATSVSPCRGDGSSYDDAVDLGSSSVRFDDVYATNGTIQTSDRNEKQDIQELSEAEQRVAVACKGLIRRYKFNSAVEAKGDDARYHFGIIAQDLQDAFTAEGLDAGDYGMFISNTWTDEEGNEQTRLGVRYNELLSFIISTL